MEYSKEVIERVKLMKMCEPNKTAMAVAMLQRAKLVEKSARCSKFETNGNLKPCTRLAMDDFIFYVSMLGYEIDTMSYDEINKCKDLFINELEKEINEIKTIRDI